MAEKNQNKVHPVFSPSVPDENSCRIKERKFTDRFFLYGAFFLPLLLLTLLRMICVQIHGGEPGTDNFYHAAMALAGPEIFSAKRFPFLAFSVWQDSFADKELLYHILLRILFFVKGIFSSDPFPFTLPVMFFVSASLAAFILLLRSLKVPAKLIFTASLLLSFGAFAFTYRFLMLRPHVFSIAFMLASCLIPVRYSGKKCAFFLFLLSFLYAWSYSNPHFILFPVLIYAFFAKKEYGKKIFLLPLIAFAGVFTGYLLHPQFPNTFLIWKIQSLDAFFSPVFYGRGYLTPKLVPMEMLPGNFSWYRNMMPFYLLWYVLLFFFVRLGEKKKSSQRYTAAEKTILLLSFVFTVGTFAVLRSVEYAVPFTAAAFAIVLKYAVQDRIVFFESEASGKRMILILIAAAFALGLLNTNLMLKSNFSNRVPTGPAKWLKENTVKGSLVVNLDWGDFPAMFYANKHNCLLWGMDPVFSYAFAPEKARKLENCVLNSIRLQNMDSRIHELTGAEYAFVLSRREKFIQYLKDCAWTVVYESKEGCIFSLKGTLKSRGRTGIK